MIIGITGYQGSGKSTIASLLVERFGFRRERFAGPLKDMLRAIGLEDGHLDGPLKEVPCALLAGRTPRYVMQRLGSEFGREMIAPDWWTLLWRYRVGPHPLVVADDVRFPNEVEIIRGHGGVVWRVSRPGHDSDGHVSESHISSIQVDAEFVNDGSIDDLVAAVERQLARARAVA
jgi:hypothetical protein